MRAVVACAFVLACGAPAKQVPSTEPPPLIALRPIDHPNTEAIEGHVFDRFYNESAVGAVIVVNATSLPMTIDEQLSSTVTLPQLIARQEVSFVVVCDDTGNYTINDVAPGAYTLSVYYNNHAETVGVDVVKGYATRVDLTINGEARVH